MLAPMPRVVRPLVAGALVLAVSGCGGIGQPAPYDSPGINGLVVPTPTADPADFVAAVDNPWFPLDPGAAMAFEVTRDGADLGTITTTVLEETEDVAGLEATGVTTVTDVDGTETTSTSWYAQDTAGNVWLVGADGGPDGEDWRAGEDGAEAGLAMPADPRVGDGWLTREVADLSPASRTVEEQSSTLVQVRDEAGTTTRTVYEKGVGLVGVEDLAAGWTAEADDR